MGYVPLILALEKTTGELPGMIGVDYEHNKIATPQQLVQVNKILIDYWRAGGLISINWAPHNPWWNDENDIAGNPDIWSHTRSSGGDMGNVDLIQGARFIRAQLYKTDSLALPGQQVCRCYCWCGLQRRFGNSRLQKLPTIWQTHCDGRIWTSCRWEIESPR